jgi:DNA invertase Pin-like site-specific DNA recombinase
MGDIHDMYKRKVINEFNQAYRLDYENHESEGNEMKKVKKETKVKGLDSAVIYACHKKGMSYTEIAAKYGCSTQAVGYHINKQRKIIKTDQKKEVNPEVAYDSTQAPAPLIIQIEINLTELEKDLERVVSDTLKSYVTDVITKRLTNLN